MRVRYYTRILWDWHLPREDERRFETVLDVDGYKFVVASDYNTKWLAHPNYKKAIESRVTQRFLEMNAFGYLIATSCK